MSVTSPSALGPFVLLHPPLAKGGMGAIYLARQRTGRRGIDRLVAVKVLLESNEANTEDSRFVEMFFDEAKAMASLQHPNIAQVYDFGEERGVYFLAMEYIAGETLGSVLRAVRAGRVPRMPVKLACGVLADVARALAHAHGGTSTCPAGLIHRDVTPSNVILSDDGITKLIDFGVARVEGGRGLTTVGEVKGKYAYMAPEYLRGEHYDHRVDIFALGVLMHETLCGERPFRGETIGQQLFSMLEREAAPLHTLNSSVPEAVSNVVLRALARNPDDRYPSCAPIAAALDEIAARLPSDDEAPTISDWLRRWFAERIVQRQTLSQQAMAVRIDGISIAPMTSLRRSLPPMESSPSASNISASGPTPSPSTPSATAPGAVMQQESGDRRALDRRTELMMLGSLLLVAIAFAALLVTTLRSSGSRLAPGEATPAASHLPTAPAVSPGSAHRLLGLMALSDRKYASALTEFDKALELGAQEQDLIELSRIAKQLTLDSAVAAATVVAPSSTPTPAPPPRSAPIHAVPTKQANPSSATSVAEAAPAPGTILFTSTPAGMTIELDGKTVGSTPLRQELAPGVHAAKLFQNGSLIRDEQVSVVSGELLVVYGEAKTAHPASKDPTEKPVVAAKPPSVAPQPATTAVVVEYGELNVNSPNVFGTVFVNGVDRGYPPIVIKHVPAGKTRVEIRVGGVPQRTKFVEVVGNVRTAVRFE